MVTGEVTAALTLRTSTAPPREVCVHVQGELDIATAAELRAHLVAALRHPCCATLVVDLRQVSFMGVRGVAVLAEVSDHAADRGVQMIVVADTGPVMRLLRLSGADGGVYTSLAAARAGVDLTAVRRPGRCRGLTAGRQ